MLIYDSNEACYVSKITLIHDFAIASVMRYFAFEA